MSSNHCQSAASRIALINMLWALGCNANAFDPQIQPPKTHDAGAEAAPADAGIDAQPDVQAETVVPGCTDSGALNFDPAATHDDGSCLYEVTVTFNLDMSCETGVGTPQVAGGGTFGDPGDHPMQDPEADGIWTLTVPLPPGLTASYTFLSDACADWSCKEKIAGQPCAVPPYDDRTLTMETEDLVINACFAKCGDGFCGECPGNGS